MFRFKQKRVHDTSAQQNFEQLEPHVFDVGDLKPTARDDAPSGWLLCDGTAVGRTQYPALFQAIGTTFGAGDGSTTFNLPDLGGRVPVGVGTHTSVDTLGEDEGEVAANRTPLHGHDAVAVTGSVSVSGSVSVNGSINWTTSGTGTRGGRVNDGTTSNIAGTFSGTGTISSATTGAIGESTGPTDGPAYLVINWLIKT